MLHLFSKTVSVFHCSSCPEYTLASSGASVLFTGVTVSRARVETAFWYPRKEIETFADTPWLAAEETGRPMRERSERPFGIERGPNAVESKSIGWTPCVAASPWTPQACGRFPSSRPAWGRAQMEGGEARWGWGETLETRTRAGGDQEAMQLAGKGRESSSEGSGKGNGRPRKSSAAARAATRSKGSGKGSGEGSGEGLTWSVKCGESSTRRIASDLCACMQQPGTK